MARLPTGAARTSGTNRCWSGAADGLDNSPIGEWHSSPVGELDGCPAQALPDLAEPTRTHHAQSLIRNRKRNHPRQALCAAVAAPAPHPRQRSHHGAHHRSHDATAGRSRLHRTGRQRRRGGCCSSTAAPCTATRWCSAFWPGSWWSPPKCCASWRTPARPPWRAGWVPCASLPSPRHPARVSLQPWRAAAGAGAGAGAPALA